MSCLKHHKLPATWYDVSIVVAEVSVGGLCLVVAIASDVSPLLRAVYAVIVMFDFLLSGYIIGSVDWSETARARYETQNELDSIETEEELKRARASYCGTRPDLPEVEEADRDG